MKQKTLTTLQLFGVLLGLCAGALAAFGQTTQPTTAPSNPAPLIGVNLDGSAESSFNPWVNIFLGFNHFDDLDKIKAGVFPPNLDASKLDANGYPLVAAKTVSGLVGVPDGDYQFSYSGPADGVTFDGSLAPVSAPTRGQDGVWHGIVKKRGGGVGVTVLPGVSDVRLIRPGYDPSTSQIWTDEYIAAAGKFALLRCMDLLRTNGQKAVHWSEHAQPGHFPYTGPAGVPYEAMFDLSKWTNRDLWINVPALADDDYVTQLARLSHSLVGDGHCLYVEYSNETWNTGIGFSFHDIFPLAGASTLPDLPANEPGKNGGFTRNAVWVGARNYQIATIFKQVWGADAGRVRHVYGGMLANPWWAWVGLDYCQKHYGDPSKYFWGLAVAPYDGLHGADAPTDLDTLFAKLNGYHADTVVPGLAGNASTAKLFNLHYLSYEFGQHLIPSAADFALKQQAQSDPRMGLLYRQNTRSCRDAGMAFICHDSFVGTYGTANTSHGFWPLSDALPLTGVKVQALMADQPPLGPVPGYPKPTTQPAPTTLPSLPVTISLDGRTYSGTVTATTVPSHE